MNGNRSNFAYALALTRSRLGFLPVNFCKFSTWLWPLVVFKIRFHTISCEWIDEIWSNFAYGLTITRSRLGVLCVNFCKFTELWPLAIVEISFPLNTFVINLMECDQILYMHWCWPDLHGDCYASIFTDIQHSYGPWLLFISIQYLGNKFRENDQV